MKKSKHTIKKIPLHGLLAILTDLYEKGVDYIDIYGDSSSETKDNLHIFVNPEYYSNNEDMDEQIDSLNSVSENTCGITLTDEDINNLI